MNTAFRAALLMFGCIGLSAFLLKGDMRTSAIADFISIERLGAHVENLHFDRNPNDRYFELERASQYIRTEFLKLGLAVEEDPLEWGGKSFKNIIAEKKGTLVPDQILILGAHYDTVPGSPGADDNGSGIAVLLETARSLCSLPLRTTVRWIAFTLEEPGFIGSLHYAMKMRCKGEKILGMISLEMVGFTAETQNYPLYVNPKYYPAVGDFIAIIGNQRSEPFLERVVRSYKKSIPRLPVEFLLVPGNGEGMEEARLSDNSSFWDQGFPALMITDTSFLRNPNYHLPSDTLETLDFEFMRKVAVGVRNAIVDLTE